MIYLPLDKFKRTELEICLGISLTIHMTRVLIRLSFTINFYNQLTESEL